MAAAAAAAAAVPKDKTKDPSDVREWAKKARTKGLPPPKNLTLDRIKLFGPEIDFLARRYFPGGHFGAVLWSEIKKAHAEEGADQEEEQELYVDVFCSTLTEAFLPAWIPADTLDAMSARCKSALNISQDCTIMLYEDVPIPVARFVSTAVQEMWKRDQRTQLLEPLNLSMGIQLIAMGANIQDIQRAAGKLLSSFPVFSTKAGENKSLSVDCSISAADNIIRPSQALLSQVTSITPTQFVTAKPGGNNVFLTLAGLGPAWWDVVMRLVALCAPVSSIALKVTNECNTLFPAPQSGHVVVPTPASAADYIPPNTFYVSGDIGNILRNVTLDIDSIEVPGVPTSAVQYSLVRVRNPAHIPRLLAAGKFCFTHEIWRSQMPGYTSRSSCGAIYRRFPTQAPSPLVIAVDSMATRMKDDAFSLEVLIDRSEIVLTAYIACPLTDEDMQRSNFLEGPIVSQALKKLATTNEGEGKMSMLEKDSDYSLSRFHCRGELRPVLAVAGIFDAATLKFKRFGAPERKRIVIDEEVETGFVRYLEEDDAAGGGAAQQHMRNGEVATRLKLLHLLYEANRGLGYGSDNDHVLFPASSSGRQQQLVCTSVFMREAFGRTKSESCYRASLGSGNGWSDWTRHGHKLPKFVFSAGVRAAVMHKWGFDFEIGESRAGFSPEALAPLVSLLRTHLEVRGGHEASAAPLWEKFGEETNVKKKKKNEHVGGGDDDDDDEESEREASGCIIDDDDDDDDQPEEKQKQDQQRNPPALNIVSLQVLAASLPQMRTMDPGIEDLIAAATGCVPISVSSPVAAAAADSHDFRFVKAETSELRFLIESSSSSSDAYDNHVAARRERRTYIGPFDVTVDDSHFESMLAGTKPLRNGMHTLGQYLALRGPATNKEREIIRNKINQMRPALLEMQDKNTRDSNVTNLMCLLDKAVPTPLKKVLLPGIVCACRTPAAFGDTLCTVYVPRLKMFVAANVVLSRSGSSLLKQQQQQQQQQKEKDSSSSPPSCFQLPALSFVQLLLQTEDGVSGTSVDQVTKSFLPMDFSRAFPNTLRQQFSDGRSASAAAQTWNLIPVRGGRGGEVWYVQSGGAGGSALSFQLYVDSRSSWNRVFPTLLGGSAAAGRGSDTAKLQVI